ncbi:hypothetical protein MRX96_032265 [Rhipicephalus microplus]
MASTVCTKNKEGFDECASIVPPPCPLAQSATANVLIPDAHDDVDESGASSLPNGAVQMRMSRSAALSLCVSMCQSKIRSVASGPVRLTRVSPDEGNQGDGKHGLYKEQKRGLMNVRPSCLHRAHWPGQLRRLFLYQMHTMTSTRVAPVGFRMVQYRCACPGQLRYPSVYRCASRRYVPSHPAQVRLTRVSPDEGIKVMASTVCTKNKKRGLMNVRPSCLHRAHWPSQLRRLFLYQMHTMTSTRVAPVVFLVVQYRCACPGQLRYPSVYRCASRRYVPSHPAKCG